MLNNKDTAPAGARRRRGRPPREATGRSREELLVLAFERFADLGYERVSLREMAGELGISDSLFNHYFGSKEQLWQEALLHVLAPLQAPVLAALHEGAEGDALQRLRASTRMVLLWGVEQPRLLRLIFREAGEDTPRGAFLRRGIGAFQEQVAAALSAARAQGLVRDLPLAAVEAMIMGAARMLVDPGLMKDRLAGALGDEAAMTAFIDGVLDTLFHGLLAPGVSG